MELPIELWIHQFLPHFMKPDDILSLVVFREVCIKSRDWIDIVLTPQFITTTLRDPCWAKKMDLAKHPSHFPSPGVAPLIRHLKKTKTRSSPTMRWIRTYFEDLFWDRDLDALLFFAERKWPLAFLIDQLFVNLDVPVSLEYILTYSDMTNRLMSYYSKTSKSYISGPWLDGFTRKFLELKRPERLVHLFRSSEMISVIYPAVCDNQGYNLWWSCDHDRGSWDINQIYPDFKRVKTELIKEYKRSSYADS